ncbi:uncharacterized protein LOC130721234 [Lotus japonicus]|uniref:uncharacterized protein LOC130721234 n=1 Tax=Lotus japonicus TaxID=34305 RepID=UPI002589A5D9|nr:uncharacterized protein LOC130721234 [Lotus japonicus]
MERGNLEEKLFKGSCISFSKLVLIMEGLAFLREEETPVIYRDVKASNILYDVVGAPVLLDWSRHFLMLGYYNFLSTFADPIVRLIRTVRGLNRSDNYSPIYHPIDSTINILFSSGTTGELKATSAYQNPKAEHVFFNATSFNLLVCKPSICLQSSISFRFSELKSFHSQINYD